MRTSVTRVGKTSGNRGVVLENMNFLVPCKVRKEIYSTNVELFLASPMISNENSASEMRV